MRNRMFVVAMAMVLAVSASATAFEARFEHQHGETVLTDTPERVVSIGYSDQDDLLALGVRPVAVREWFGDRDKATWPWAYDLWGDADPMVLPRGELDLEQIAALEPDLIVAITAGIDEATYRQLSQIAPTLPQSGDYVTWGMPWQERTRWIGRAVDREQEAEAAIADIEERFERIREANPEWTGRQALAAYYWDGELGVYSANDLRGQFLEEIGLEVPPQVNRMAGDRFYTEVSLENLDLLNVDTVIWLSMDNAREEASRVPGRELMAFHREGREIYADGALAGAFSFMTPLSIQYLLDHLVPEFERTLAGQNASDMDASTGQAMPETRRVTDYLGNQADIPVSPQRVVYLGTSPADLIQLGIEPVGASLSVIQSQVAYPELLEGIEDVGGMGNFDFEAIAALDPELIILDGVVHEDSYPHAARIAPTVAFDSRQPMFDRLRLMADLVNREQRAEAWIESYEDRAAATVDTLAVDDGATATAMIILGGNVYVMGRNGLAVTLYDVLGFSPPPEVQAVIDSNRRFISVSEEMLPNYAGDWVFVLAQSDEDKEWVENSRTFNLIPAVQEGRVHVLDGQWNYGDPVTRDRLLEELARIMSRS